METQKKVVVIKVKRPKQKQQPKRTRVVKKERNGLVARSHFDSKEWNDFFDSCKRKRAVLDSVKVEIKFDPEITLSPKWRSQFHYPEEDTDTSGWIVKDEDYVSTIDTSSI